MIWDNTPQKMLSLRFEAKELWSDLRNDLGVSETGAAIILDIGSTDGWVSYSRTARHYDLPKRYRTPLYTYRKVVGEVDLLASKGLLDHDRRSHGERGWQSAIRANNDLRAIRSRVLGTTPPKLVKPAEAIWLRDQAGRLIDYNETQMIGRMRNKLESFNEAIMSGAIEPTVAAPLVRIWNQNMQRGGRFYALGNSWQNMKADVRRRITIEGEPVAELDYRTLHPAILYAEVQAPLPDDCYDLPKWPRKVVKVAMLTLINARTGHSARLSIAHNAPWAGTVVAGSQHAMHLAAELINDIKERHGPIVHAFHSDAGARLMAIDAAISEAVMSKMLSQGIVVLPVHDSFLVPASKADKMEEAMVRAAYDVGRLAVNVEAG